MTNDITVKRPSLFRRMLLYVIPIIFGNVMQILYNVADTAVVGRFAEDGEQALAAVGSSAPVLSILIIVMVSFAVGASAMMAQDVGRGDTREIEKTMHTSLAFSLVLAIPTMLVGLIFTEELFLLVGLPDSVIPSATLYLRIYMLGTPFSFFYHYGASILYAKGDSRFPFIVMAGAGLFNLSANLVFVIAFRMDVAGVALATVLSQLLSAVMMVYRLYHMGEAYKFRFRDLRVHRSKMPLILKVGTATCLQNALGSVVNLAVQSSINSFGQTVIAGNTASVGIESVATAANGAFGQAAMTFVGQAYGAKNADGMRRALRTAVLMTLCVAPVMALLAITFARPLLGIYIAGNEAAIAAGASRLIIVLSLMPLSMLAGVYGTALNAVGKPFFPTLTSVISNVCITIAWIFIFFPMDALHSYSTLFYYVPIGYVFLFVSRFIYYRIYFRRILCQFENAPEGEKASCV